MTKNAQGIGLNNLPVSDKIEIERESR
jgi:hypothetical protein